MIDLQHLNVNSLYCICCIFVSVFKKLKISSLTIVKSKMPKFPNELEAFKMLLMAIDLSRQESTPESSYHFRVYNPATDGNESEDEDNPEKSRELNKTGKLMHYFLESRGKLIQSRRTVTNLCIEVKPTTLLEMLAISRISGYPYDKVVFSECFRPLNGMDISNGATRESVNEVMKKLPKEVLKVLYEKCNGDVYEMCQSRPGYFATLIKDSFKTITDEIEKTYLDTFTKITPAEQSGAGEAREQSSISPALYSSASEGTNQRLKRSVYELEKSLYENDDDDDFENDDDLKSNTYKDSEKTKVSGRTESEHGKEVVSASRKAANTRKAASSSLPRKKMRTRENSVSEFLIRNTNFYPRPVRVFGYSSMDEVTNKNVTVIIMT